MSNCFCAAAPEKHRPIGRLLTVILYLSGFLLFCRSVLCIDTAVSTQQLQAVQEALTAAALQCYALEGGYPPDLSYLKENYGVQIDEKAYIIHYELCASNIMPDIVVLPRLAGKG